MTDADRQSIIENVISMYRTNSIPYGSFYITPDGIILDLGNTGFGHSDLAQSLYELGVEEDYKIGKASQYLKSLGCIRGNSDIKYRYIELTGEAPTDEQYKILLLAIDVMYGDVQITFKDCFRVYRGRSSEEIVKLIKRYYATGIAYEEVTE